MTAKRVPQRANKKAGTGKASPPQKKLYDANYSSSPKQKAQRAATNAYRRTHKVAANTDVSHTKSGKLTTEPRKTNRARQGKNGKSTLRRA